MFLVCHSTWEDHVTKGYNNMDRSCSRSVTIHPNLVAIGTVVMETMVLVFRAILT